MIEIRKIDKAHAGDIKLKNEPFPIYGRLIPGLHNGIWSYTVAHFETAAQLCFPDEDYDYDAMVSNTTFLGAYEGDTCIGLAVMQDAFFRYWYLYDLKVNAEYRGQGVGRKLLDRAMEMAKEKGCQGIYAVCQDNNLGACRFYLKAGFQIGGFDNRVYDGTPQAEKADIIFYRS